MEISRAGRSERLRIEEVTPEHSAPILQHYLKRVPVVRPFFDVTPNGSRADIIAQAPRHPVFRHTSP